VVGYWTAAAQERQHKDAPIDAPSETRSSPFKENRLGYFPSRFRKRREKNCRVLRINVA